MDQALKSQLIHVIDPMFLNGIRIGPVGFATRTACDLLDHLYLTYGKVTTLDLCENDISVKNQYNSTIPIKSLFK